MGYMFNTTTMSLELKADCYPLADVSLQYLLIRHTLDVMHIERNVCTSALGYVLGEKDTVQMRADMQDKGTMRHLHLRQRGSSETYLKPHHCTSYDQRKCRSFWRAWERSAYQHATPQGSGFVFGRGSCKVLKVTTTMLSCSSCCQ
jgi:hypothetical protein